MRIRTLVVVAVLNCSPLPAQSADEQQRFAGTWEAKFKGRVICTLKLEAGEKLSGAMHGCSVQVNADGDLVETEPVEHADEPSPIANARIEGERLTFEEKDAEDTLKCEFTLTGEGRAELSFVDAPVKMKPVRFERQ